MRILYAFASSAIRGCIKIAIYHFESKVISRSSGRSAVATAAYASCSKLYNDYDGVLHDYTRKQGCIYSEIFLPENANRSWQSREKLWNAVEEAEKSKDSRLAREIVVALPVELGPDEWTAMVKELIVNECVAKGMCADVSIHNADTNNPHAHILLTVRPLDEYGKWQAKTRKEYLCRRGDEEQGFTAAEYRVMQDEGWEKQYSYKVNGKKMYLTPSQAAQFRNVKRASKSPKSTRYGRQNPVCAEWNSEEQIIHWRKAWEDVTNRSLERNNCAERVDCRSFKDRGIDEQPTIHEGVTSRHDGSDKHERREHNRRVKEDNRILHVIRARIKKLADAMKATAKDIAGMLEELRNAIIMLFCRIMHNKAEAQDIRRRNKIHIDRLRKYDDISSKIREVKSELKDLKQEQKNTGALHVIKHYKLHSRLSDRRKMLEELKNERELITHTMNCRSSDDVRNFRKKVKDELKAADDMLKQNRELTAKKNELAGKFKETLNEIEPDMVQEVLEERSRLRTEIYISRLKRELGRMYDWYDPDILEAASADTDRALGECPVPAVKPELSKEPKQRISVREKLERNKKIVKEQKQQPRRQDIQEER